MRTIILPLIVASVLVQAANQTEMAVVRRWIDRVTSHQPGIVDQPLLDIAAESPDNLDTVRRRLREALKSEQAERRNDILRRGALAHTDIALLMPDRAAEYVQSGDGREQSFFFDAFETPRTLYRRDADALVYSMDGEYVAFATETAHWSTARGLLRGISPYSGSDEFVKLWYRAIAAFFEDAFLLGNAKYHLVRALDVLPRDPMILFYAGAMHEATASERIQSVPKTRPQLAAKMKFPSSRDEWHAAEQLLGAAIKEKAPAEARLHYGYVLGRLGKHEEAASTLRSVAPQLDDRRLQYFDALFLGSEEMALGHLTQARESFERAAALFPTAQSPLLAMSDLFRRSQNRTAALDVLARIQALPVDPQERDDPWLDYFRSFASDASDQLERVRAWVTGKEPK